MRVCGVIAEYDPFHRGHAWHLSRAKEACGADYLVCVLSTAFTQRGSPSFFATCDRARMALLGGADAVFALPVSFSVMEADRFASGGVQALGGLGVVTHLSFGCEDSASFPLLERCASALAHPSPALENAISQKLGIGLSHVRASAEALSETLGIPPDILRKPNNSLAVAYLRRLEAEASAMVPVPVQRAGRRNERHTDGFLSSSVIRALLTAGETEEALAALPDACVSSAGDCLARGAVCAPDALDQALLYRLTGMDVSSLARYTTLRDGLPELILKHAREASSLSQLLDRTVSRRYTRSGLRRYLAQMLLDLPRDRLPDRVSCVRLLGFRESARPLLAAVKRQSSLPVIAKAADCAEAFREDDRAERIRSLGCRSSASLFQQSPVILRRDAI